jgi:hypothetical protein
MTSATWQTLPPPLLEAVMNGVLLSHEAAEIHDLSLMSDEWIEVPTHLQEAVCRLSLWQMEIDETRH